jgi:hypothetical protein
VPLTPSIAFVKWIILVRQVLAQLQAAAPEYRRDPVTELIFGMGLYMAATAATCFASRLITLPVFFGALLSSCGRHTRLAWIFHRPSADIASCSICRPA